MTSTVEAKKGFIPFTMFSRSVITGFIGGLLCSVFWLFLYYFNFSEITFKSIVLRSWLTSQWTSGWKGDLVSIFLFGLLSILIALVYYAMFKKINSIWMGVIFGGIVWLIFFYIVIPLLPNIKNVSDINTISSTIGLFILYGTFIGYSISFDYYETSIFEEESKVK